MDTIGAGIQTQNKKNSSSPSDNDSSANDDSSSLDRQMQMVMYLMSERAIGKATNEEVETAVERMLELQRLRKDEDDESKKQQSSQVLGLRRKAEETRIEHDTENYDDSDDENEKTASPVVASNQSEPISKDTSKEQPVEVDFTVYEEIPLGKQGAKMMTNFGDGKRPKPEVVESTLMGARRMLQIAIQDARHIRRKQKKLFKAAKLSLRDKATEQSLKGEWSSELLFRAGERLDRLSFDPKCGFDIEDVRQIFPEEMNAFTRWLELHKDAEKSSNSKEEENDDDVDNPIKTYQQSAEDGGHLQVRAAQFDVRTDNMKEDWYIRFADLRKGSFLPRQRGHETEEDAEIDSNRKSNVQGRVVGEKVAAWSRLSLPSVRFLHWVGFDPQSPLPPPNDITTQALAFLGYDFFGRIVEKAILLRNIKKQQQSSAESNEVDVLLELKDGEQLEAKDIKRALDDPDIKPVPLYSSSKNKQGPQLYFGPGFESRLELEMEEYVRNTKNHPLSEEEMQIRKEEDELFESLAAPPSRDGIASLFDDDDDLDDALGIPAAKKMKLSEGNS